jgi:hypothetical protein
MPEALDGEERRGGFAAVGVAVGRLAAAVIGKRGAHSLSRLKAHWTAIAGPEWGDVSWPLALGRDGSLKLRAAHCAALELQHRAPLLIERINLYLGREAVRRIALVQGAVASSKRAPALRPLAEKEAQAIAEKVGGIADPELREALGRFGRALEAREDEAGLPGLEHRSS